MKHFSEVETLQKESFPAVENYSMEQLLALSESPNIEYYSFWEEDKLCGLLYYNVGETMVYLFFLAVNPAIRSKGYGRKLLQWLSERYPDKAVAGNIEAIGFGADNEEQRIRRLAFYERNGFHRIPIRMNDDSGLYDIIFSGSNFSSEEFMRLIKELGFDAYHPQLQKID